MDANPKSRVSSHFIVGQDGRVAQMVDIRDTAWCNGTSTNPRIALIMAMRQRGW